MIKYSFIIPHHNCPQLLNRLLSSIPSREDIEVIVVDDNSDKDKRPGIVRDDVQTIEIPEKESGGAGHARNIGLERATGKWLLFADSDDLYVDGFINELDKYCDNDYDIVIFRAYINYIEGGNNNDSFRNRIEDSFDVFSSSKKEPTDIHRVACATNVSWNKMYNHEFISSIGCRFEEIPIGNDAWFVINAGVKASNIKIIDKRLYCYIYNTNSITFSKRPISHYYLLIKSRAIINKLLLCGANLEDLITSHRYYKEKIIKDHGVFAYCKLIMFQISIDSVYLRIMLKKVFCKILGVKG